MAGMGGALTVQSSIDAGRTLRSLQALQHRVTDQALDPKTATPMQRVVPSRVATRHRHSAADVLVNIAARDVASHKKICLCRVNWGCYQYYLVLCSLALNVSSVGLQFVQPVKLVCLLHYFSE